MIAKSELIFLSSSRTFGFISWCFFASILSFLWEPTGWTYLPPADHIARQAVKKRLEIKKATANYHIVSTANGNRTPLAYDFIVQWNETKIASAYLAHSSRDHIVKKLNTNSALLALYFSSYTPAITNFLETVGLLERKLPDEDKKDSSQVTLKRAYGKICYQIKNLRDDHLTFLIEKDSYLPVFFTFRPEGESFSLDLQTDHFMSIGAAQVPRIIHLSKDGAPWLDIEYADSREPKNLNAQGSNQELPEDISALNKWL